MRKSKRRRTVSSFPERIGFVLDPSKLLGRKSELCRRGDYGGVDRKQPLPFVNISCEGIVGMRDENGGTVEIENGTQLAHRPIVSVVMFPERQSKSETRPRSWIFPAFHLALIFQGSGIIPFFFNENMKRSDIKTSDGGDFRSEILDKAVQGRLSDQQKEDIKCVIVLCEAQENPNTLFMLQKIGQITGKKVAIGGEWDLFNDSQLINILISSYISRKLVSGANGCLAQSSTKPAGCVTPNLRQRILQIFNARDSDSEDDEREEKSFTTGK